MKHPNLKLQMQQEDFLNHCPDELKEFHARLFRIGNAAFIYHNQALSAAKVSEEYFNEWLVGLPNNIRKDMQMKGYENCKTILPFTRYVNERCDIGMDDWMKTHLSDEDFKFWNDAGKTKI